MNESLNRLLTRFVEFEHCKAQQSKQFAAIQARIKAAGVTVPGLT